MRRRTLDEEYSRVDDNDGNGHDECGLVFRGYVPQTEDRGRPGFDGVSGQMRPGLRWSIPTAGTGLR